MATLDQTLSGIDMLMVEHAYFHTSGYLIKKFGQSNNIVDAINISTFI
jgi:hypothetical protein